VGLKNILELGVLSKKNLTFLSLLLVVIGLCFWAFENSIIHCIETPKGLVTSKSSSGQGLFKFPVGTRV
jgi:hypothetical protein